MSKGGGTTTNTSSNSPPPQVLAQYENVIGQANQVASTPYTTGGFNASNMVAGFTPDQASAFNTVDQSQGIQQPYLAAGQQDLTASQTPLWNGVQQYNPSTMAQYANPYLNQAVGSTEAQMNNMDAQQQQQVIGNAVSSGAWGGDRSAIAQSELANQQSLANNQTIANMENTGFNQQQGEFNTQQASQLGANEANAWLGSQGAALESGLGQTAQNAALTGANAQYNMGTAQQTQNQSMLNIPYEQFQAQQAYPFQTTGWLSGISTGLGSNSGGTSTSTQTQPSSNSLFKRGGFVPKFAAGGFAPSLASGGVGGNVPDPSQTYFSSIGNSPGGSSSGGNGIPKPANIQSQPAPNPIAEMSGIANIGNSGASIYNSLSGAPASSLSSSSGIAGLANDFGGGSSFANSSLSPSSVPGYLSANALDSNPGMGAAAMDSLSADGSSIIPAASSSSGFWSGLGDAVMSIFSANGGAIPSRADGGKIPHRAFGGNLLPDVVSGIGDVVGAFFGDPMAGSQATGILSQVDGGETKPGLQLSSLARGGVTKGFAPRHYDGGGGIGLPTAQQTGASPGVANVANQLQNMTVEQLQQLNARSGGRNPQIQMALQRKQMTGGAAQQPQQAGIAPMAAQAQGAAPPAQAAAVPSGAQPENIMQQNGFARGGFTPQHLSGEDGVSSVLPIPDNSTSMPTDLPSTAANSNTPPAANDNQGFMPQQATSTTGMAPLPSHDDFMKNYNATVMNAAPYNQVNPWISLATGVLGAAAGNSPHISQNLARGAMEGLQNYGGQQKEAAAESEKRGTLQEQGEDMYQKFVDARATLNQQNAELAERTTNDAAMRKLQQEQIEKSKYVPAQGFTKDPTTGQLIPTALSFDTSKGTYLNDPNTILSGKGGAGTSPNMMMDFSATDPTIKDLSKKVEDISPEKTYGLYYNAMGALKRNPQMNQFTQQQPGIINTLTPEAAGGVPTEDLKTLQNSSQAMQSDLMKQMKNIRTQREFNVVTGQGQVIGGDQQNGYNNATVMAAGTLSAKVEPTFKSELMNKTGMNAKDADIVWNQYLQDNDPVIRDTKGNVKPKINENGQTTGLNESVFSPASWQPYMNPQVAKSIKDGSYQAPKKVFIPADATWSVKNNGWVVPHNGGYALWQP